MFSGNHQEMTSFICIFLNGVMIAFHIILYDFFHEDTTSRQVKEHWILIGINSIFF